MVNSCHHNWWTLEDSNHTTRDIFLPSPTSEQAATITEQSPFCSPPCSLGAASTSETLPAERPRAAQLSGRQDPCFARSQYRNTARLELRDKSSRRRDEGSDLQCLLSRSARRHVAYNLFVENEFRWSHMHFIQKGCNYTGLKVFLPNG